MRRSLLFVLLLGLAVMAGCAHTASPTTKPAFSSPREQRAMEELTNGTKSLQDGDYEQAQKHLEASLKADAFSGLAHNNLGMVYYQQARYYDAAWQFQYASKVLPSRPEPHNNLGLVLEATGKTDEAIIQYQQAMALAPTGPQYLGNLVRAHVRRGDRDEKTRQLLQELLVIETRPDWRQWVQRELATRYLVTQPTIEPSSK